MRLEFYNWVLQTISHPEDRLLDVGELCFVLEGQSSRPLEHVFFEFATEIEECLEEAATEMDHSDAIGYTKDVFGLELFESDQDRRLKMLELAAFHILRKI